MKDGRRDEAKNQIRSKFSSKPAQFKKGTDLENSGSEVKHVPMILGSPPV